MNYAIIVAGGSGKRMNSDLPKQFLTLNEKPILYYTIAKFLKCLPDIQIIVVLPADFVESNHFLANYFPSTPQIKVVFGGITRFHSVQNGLNAIEDVNGIVFIHDGVRPFVSEKVLKACFEQAKLSGSAIPCIDLKDSIRLVNATSNFSADRSLYKAIQTPQTFKTSAIKLAFEQTYQDTFTDEASVMEAAGLPVFLVEGNEENIKITTPQDLIFAQAILAQDPLFI